MADQKLQSLVERLEKVTARLESVGAGGGAGGGAAAGGGGDPSAWLQEYDDEIMSRVDTYVAESAKIGGDCNEQAAMVKAAFDAQRAFLNVAATSSKPDDATFNSLLADTGKYIGQTIEFRESKRGSPHFNHLTALAEGIPALGWVQVTPKPAPHADNMGQAAEFSLNRVLKDNPDHKPWVFNLKELFKGLVAFIKKNHTTGLVWNPKGGAAKAGAASAAAPAAAAKPKPKVAAAAPVGKGGLFDGISGGVTAGLKKVTDDQKVYKQKDRPAAGPIKDAPKKAPAKKFGGGPKGDPKFALEGNKWVVEFQQGVENLEIENPEGKHVVYVYGCQDSVINVKGKVNSIMLDNCKKCGIVATSVMATVEIVNCSSVKMQVTGTVPSIAIDKTSGCQVFLSKECLGVELVTAKSDEMNVVIPPDTDDGDITEIAIPEQFKSTYDAATKTLKTEAVAHL